MSEAWEQTITDFDARRAVCLPPFSDTTERLRPSSGVSGLAA